ncbi:MAG: biofilm PGA synthesis protein PgaB [Prevotella sp.]|nr:biofilm PGA synthesis protein PgaB [Prevotella sp.]
MKNNNRFSWAAAVVALTAFLVVSCGQSGNVSEKSLPQIRVGVFNGNGGAQTCVWEAFAACSLDGDMVVRYVTTADIAAGALDSLDVIVVPGGGGTRQYQNLGQENLRRIKEFVRQGGGAVGICAGAYLFSNTPEYSCLAINGAQAIDIEHDNRGHGIVGFSLTDEGKKVFGEYANLDTLFCMYYEGPVFVAAPNDSIKFVEFATMLSDVHEEGGAPSNMTNNRPFFIGNRYGKGKVFSSIAHPESTAGKMWMIARMVRWTQTADDDDSLQQMVENQSFSYPEDLKNPNLVNREILMTVADLKTEADCFKKLVYGSENEKIEALEWLKAHQSWDAKRWIQGALFDESAEVRAAAAEYIADIHYFTFIKDVRAAYEAETDEAAKQRIGASLDRLLKLSDKPVGN